MQRAFVTGGSGFLGRNLIRRLRADGIAVVALARSPRASEAVRALGATAAAGDLEDQAAMTTGMAGCDTVFHAAACVEEWEPLDLYERVNVAGTRRALAAAQAAGVGCFVHVGTEAVFADGRSPMDRLDDTTPLPERPLARYPASKAAAEKLVRAANADGFRTVVIRPRLIWGRDDTSLLPKIIAAVRSGRFMWLDGGQFLTSTTHVDNVCEGLLRGAELGRGGDAYFVTDGAPRTMHEFLGALIRTQGVEPGERALPLWLARIMALSCEALWSILPLRGSPPIHRIALCLAGQAVVCDDSRARAELGYREIVTVEQGLAGVERIC